ncbi:MULTISPECIES: alpha/beta fold hydrolase [unclassified Moraxella]|uniref:alpha/beta fold hydrolase n=1 Tax=unclassified Moraxella TaxID=2685852 RepID=UPI003AF60E10
MTMVKTCHLLNTDDGEQVALWHIAKQPFNQSQPNTKVIENAIFLTHGAFSDKRIMLGIAEFLATLNYQCFILEWRGHGDSPKPAKEFDFNTVAKYDIKASFDYLINDLQVKSLHCITHSGGGIALTLCLIHYPHYQAIIKSASIVACQAFGAVQTRVDFVRLWLAKQLTKHLGFIPAKWFKLGVINETYATMQPWFDWNLTKQFVNLDNSIDYRTQMPKVKVPIIAIAGLGDKWIAPIAGCKAFLDAFEHEANEFMAFGIRHQHLEDYTHGRIMLSKNASGEVWQAILNWITLHT